jgi:hypothetical protein
MRETLGLVLTFLMTMNSVPAAMTDGDVATRIASPPCQRAPKSRFGLKSRQKLRGSMAAVSDSGFALIDSETAWPYGACRLYC